jgi:hypothetical protein
MVHEHGIEEEIQEEKGKSMEEIKFLIEYELLSLWWAEFIAWQWLRDIISYWIERKVMRKWKRYKFTKMMADVKETKEES